MLRFEEKVNCKYFNYTEYVGETFISRFQRQNSSGINSQALFNAKRTYFIDRWGHS